MKYKILLIVLLVVFANKSNAQYFCQTSEVNLERAMQIQPILARNYRFYDGARPMVRLALHRVTRANGNDGFTWAEIQQWIGTLLAAYEPFNICFTVVSTDNIANDTYFGLTSFTGNDWANLINENRVTNAINIYFVEDANRGGLATGFLFGAGQFPTVTIARNASSINIFNTPVLAHELGHCLGLLHTHSTTSCTENIERTGSNASCETCGDFLCNTPADPNLNISTSNVNDADCVFIGGQTQGGQPYTPDTRNIMSYSLPNCIFNFTAGQGARMRNFILNTGNMDDFFIPFNRTITGAFPTGGLTTAYYSVENNLSGAVSNVMASSLTISSGEVEFEAGNEIVLNPGFEVISGANFIAHIGSYSCIEPLTVNSAKTEIEANLTEEHNTNRLEENFTLFPNPTTNLCNIQFELIEEEELLITLTDLMGKELMVIDQNKHSKGSFNIQFSTSGFASGIYFVRFNNGQRNEMKKLVIGR